MEFILKDYKIKTNQYQYILSKKKGKHQWETIGYYDTLSDAIEQLINYRIRVETNITLDFSKPKDIKAKKEELLKMIDEIITEIEKMITKTGAN